MAEAQQVAREAMQDTAVLCEIARYNIAEARALRRARRIAPFNGLPPAGASEGSGLPT